MHSATARHDPVRFISTDVHDDAGVVRWAKAPALITTEHLEHVAKDGRRLPVPISATPLVSSDSVLTCGYDGRIRRHDRNLGSQCVVHRMAGPIYPTPVLTNDGRAVILGSRGTLACLNPNGQLLWEVETRGPAAASPTLVSEEQAAICHLGGHLSLLSLADGHSIWSVSLPRPWYHKLGSPDAEREPYATPLSALGLLVVAAGEHALCFDLNGHLCWSVDLDATVRASPVFVPEVGRVVLGLIDGRVVSLDLETGRIACITRLPGPIYASPIASGGRICFSTTGQVFGLVVETLAIDWTHLDAVKDHGSITVAPNGDFTYVTREGSIVAIASEGKFRYELRPRNSQAPLRFDGTPAVCADGWLYCASYDGLVASFSFPQF